MALAVVCDVNDGHRTTDASTDTKVMVWLSPLRGVVESALTKVRLVPGKKSEFSDTGQ